MNWIVPPLREEIGEFERVANTFGIQLSSLTSLFHNGTVVDLDEETWSVVPLSVGLSLAHNNLSWP